ncbi:MAG: stage II sporulation protein M, partial [Bacteroidota bacterium]
AGLISGYFISLHNFATFENFFDSTYAETVNPISQTTIFEAVGNTAQFSSTSFSYMFISTAVICISCLVMGYAFGIPVFLLLFIQGASIGGLLEVFLAEGGITTLTKWFFSFYLGAQLAILLSCTAGFVVAEAYFRRGYEPLIQALLQSGRRASVLLLTAILILSIQTFIGWFVQFWS